MLEVIPQAALGRGGLNVPHESTSEPIIDTPPLESLGTISVDEAVRLGAVDSGFFSHTFFPRTFRQTSAPIHPRVWGVLEDPTKPLVNLQMFRGSAKTTLLRTFTAKRIAYRLSRTILYVGASEPSASRSIQWLRGQVDRNKLFASTFGLVRGKKWHETEVEIESTITGDVSWVLGVGITSNLRGINFDDYRPDLIILDDVLTDENVLTAEAREKTIDLILGAVRRSLAPATEEPNAKLVMLQTPIHQEDATAKAAAAPDWYTVRFGCWTEETEDLPDDEKLSSWPERFPTKTLLQDKAAAAAVGKLSIFLKEMECKVVSSETAVFKPTLINFYDKPPVGGTSVLAIDPVPPASDREIAKNLSGKDFEALVLLTRQRENYYLREYRMNRGHDPSWTLNTAFELALRYRISYIAVDTTAYQRTLKWLLEKEMQRRGQYYVVIPDGGRVSKFNKIVDTIAPLLAQRRFYVRREHGEFLSDLELYPSLKHDDLLDAIGIGLRALVNPAVELGEGEYSEIDESQFPELEFRPRCP